MAANNTCDVLERLTNAVDGLTNRITKVEELEELNKELQSKIIYLEGSLVRKEDLYDHICQDHIRQCVKIRSLEEEVKFLKKYYKPEDNTK